MISALDRAGVATDARGYIQVDDGLATTVPGIWALGDCNGRGAFTHTAYNDFEIVAANLLDGERRKVGDRIAAYALYIDPPLGRVGLTERQARASGRPVMIGARPMSRVSRAVEKGETQGLMKIVADAESRQILGAAILGPGGDEAIHGIVDAMNARVPYTELAWAVPIHPTVSELIPTVLRELKPLIDSRTSRRRRARRPAPSRRRDDRSGRGRAARAHARDARPRRGAFPPATRRRGAPRP